MTITTGFFIALAVLVIGTIIGFINMATIMSGSRSIQGRFMFHVLASVMTSLGSLVAVITGIIWIVTKFTS